MSEHQKYNYAYNKRRFNRTSGFAQHTGQYNNRTIKSNQNDGFYFYGSKRKEKSEIYKFGTLFLFIPFIVLLLFWNNLYIAGALIMILGVLAALIYLYILLRS